MRDDRTILGEFSVYPGHAITIAYLITKVFPTYEAATAPSYDRAGKPLGWCEALSNNDIPGAGGNVHNGVDVLRKLHEGQDIETVYAWADQVWASCDTQKERRPDRWKQGQDQADTVKPRLAAEIADWFARSYEQSSFGKTDGSATPPRHR